MLLNSNSSLFTHRTPIDNKIKTRKIPFTPLLLILKLNSPNKHSSRRKYFHHCCRALDNFFLLENLKKISFAFVLFY